MTTAYSITQLQAKMLDDLALCRSDLERSCCAALSGKEIRELAYATAERRSLTQREYDIARMYGFKGATA